ncbi:hypothetical protein ACFSL6_20185 [Paenibacillus thailandensis]|uniref:Uncharacterized protein n=1 Tax=Paenibacillus thailandensis TaxID=393250 RepID=A0ABW5R0B0_9BACL
MKRISGKRKYRLGEDVPQDGLYSDDWGSELVLISGERFPAHPYMGDTRWTYIGPPECEYARAGRNGKSNRSLEVVWDG